MILTPAGSAGDVNPFIALGRELRARGHDVVVLTAEPFESAVRSAGLEFVSVLSTGRFDEAVADPDLWHPTRGIRAIFRMVDRPTLAALWNAIEDQYEPGRTVLVGHTLSFPTRVFEEVHDVPAVTVQLAPIAFRSLHGQPVMPPRLDLNRLPVWLRRTFWWIADRVGIDPLAAPALHPFFRDHGLEPERRLFQNWVHSPQRVVGFFPDWFGPPQPDWPSQTRLVGFPLYDGFGDVALDNELSTYLESGPPVVVFTPGSANRQAIDFFDVAARATRDLGCRALFVTPYRDQLPDPLADHTHHVLRAPFRALFPRCAAVVHHGGIGTTAQALAAGVPQLVWGPSFDQPDNGTRLERLGVGRLLTPRGFTPIGVRDALGALMGDPRVAAAVHSYAERMDSEGRSSAVQRAADEVEAVARR